MQTTKNRGKCVQKLKEIFSINLIDVAYSCICEREQDKNDQLVSISSGYDFDIISKAYLNKGFEFIEHTMDQQLLSLLSM